MILLSSSVTFLLLLYGSLPSNWEQCIVYHLFGGLFFSNQICRRELAFFPSLQINDVRKILGPIANKFPVLYSDASISRYLRARNWNTKKAAKMLKNTLKWRLEFKPEKIRWVYASSTFWN